MSKETDRYPLQRVRHSKETKPQKKSFQPLDDYNIGIEIDWSNEKLRYFLYKKRKKSPYMESEWVGFYDGELALRKPLYEMVNEYFVKTGKSDTLPIYTKIELNLPVGHLHYHIWAGTLQRVLEKEIIYN